MATVVRHVGENRPIVAILANTHQATLDDVTNVQFIAGPGNGAAPVIDIAGTVVDAATATVSATPGTYAADQVGRWQAIWQLTWSDGTIENIPGDRHDTLIVIPTIDD